MDGAAFILVINLSIAGLVAAAFLVMSLFRPSCRCARWFALAYAMGVVNTALEAVIPFTSDYHPFLTVAYAALLAGMGMFNVGLARMYSLRPPWRIMGVLFVASIVLQVATQYGLARDSLLRMTLYQAPYFLMQALSVALVVVAQAKRRLDVALVVLLSASAVHFLSKPFLALASGGMGASPRTYLASTYALFSQSSSSIFAIAIALLVMIMLVKKLLEELTQRTRTDPLSGLLNRDGLKERFDKLLSERKENGQPLSLIICDLDHFKDVNDTYGHPCGDKVIVAFARKLREAARADYALGRLGGEEFAVVLPGCNLAGARLFAENVRSAFANLPVEGVPAHLRFTASFGVAELRGESVSEALGRADRALYRAKADGRNCVRADGKADGPVRTGLALTGGSSPAA